MSEEWGHGADHQLRGGRAEPSPTAEAPGPAAGDQSRTSIDLVALARAIEQRLQVRRVHEQCWEVSSHSQPERWYSVYRYASGDLECDCPAGRHGRMCKHIAIVRVIAATGVAPAPREEDDLEVSL